MFNELSITILNVFRKRVAIVNIRVTRISAVWNSGDVRQIMKLRDCIYRKTRKSKNLKHI